MSLNELYQEVVIDHNHSPRNFGRLEEPDRTVEGDNPLCGDRLRLYLKIVDGRVQDVAFDGNGCAISIASASMMTEAAKGKTLQEAETLFEHFHRMVTGNGTEEDEHHVGKLATLAGVREYPSRVKCATLGWHMLHSALADDGGATVSTENEE